jgi:hypothetical protein
MNFTKNKNLMIGLGAAALLVVGYFLFFNGSPTPADLTSGTATNPAELLFINLAGKLDPVVFNGTVLSDPRFTALIDIRTAIIPETTGRPDPFAPIGKGKK